MQRLSTPIASGSRSRVASQRFRTLLVITLLLLAAQFLIGMLVNLFVQVPSAHPGANADNYFVGVAQGVAWALAHSALALQLHVIVGLLLFLAALALLALAIIARRRSWIIVSALGLFGIMGAGFNGASFMNYGHDFSSLIMSIGFLLAAISYVFGLSTR